MRASHVRRLARTVDRLIISKPSWQTSGRRSLSFSMESLKELRATSGAPIVDCKKALEQVNGDMSAAMDWLREHGAAKASSKVAGRVTAEGLVGLSMDSQSASLVKVSSETDFAGRSSKFVDLVLNVADAVRRADVVEEDTVADIAVSEGQTVKDLMDEAIVAIRENLSVASATKMVASEGNMLVGYVHNKVDASNAGTALAVVEVGPADGAVGEVEAIGKKLAMHIVAARPQYLKPEDVPAEEINKEKAILMKQLESSGKPPEILEKIVLGRLKKFYEGTCLVEQQHMIEESNPKVAAVLKDHGISIKRFESLFIG